MSEDTLEVVAGPGAAAEVAAFCRSTLEHRLDPEQMQALELVVEELVTNVVRHGYAGAAGPIHVMLETPPEGGVSLILDDRAPLFDPTRAEPDPSTMQEGGRGITLVRSLVDTFGWEPAPEGGNIVRCSIPSTTAGTGGPS